MAFLVHLQLSNRTSLCGNRSHSDDCLTQLAFWKAGFKRPEKPLYKLWLECTQDFCATFIISKWSEAWKNFSKKISSCRHQMLSWSGCSTWLGSAGTPRLGLWTSTKDNIFGCLLSCNTMVEPHFTLFYSAFQKNMNSEDKNVTNSYIFCFLNNRDNKETNKIDRDLPITAYRHDLLNPLRGFLTGPLGWLMGEKT